MKTRFLLIFLIQLCHYSTLVTRLQFGKKKENHYGEKVSSQTNRKTWIGPNRTQGKQASKKGPTPERGRKKKRKKEKKEIKKERKKEMKERKERV